MIYQREECGHIEGAKAEPLIRGLAKLVKIGRGPLAMQMVAELDRILNEKVERAKYRTFEEALDEHEVSVAFYLDGFAALALERSMSDAPYVTLIAFEPRDGFERLR